ncbi:MAG: enoyl-CoA hydratase/isomerase family protein [Deltaproteobacteria bacterium]|nr:enoyl-CoA hydratase/isomerase family protein [Deltaproteobacteria bacterium]
MQGPMRSVRQLCLDGLDLGQEICHWEDGASYLYRIPLRFRGKNGTLICYSNPPVHQVGNPGLDAYLSALEDLSMDRAEMDFLLLYGANDPVHAGGDLKESLRRLETTLEHRRELEARNAPAEQIELLFKWADDRLKKGLALYRGMRSLAEGMRIVAVCGGGSRYGGSAEIALMADVIVGDSRSAMCFSEAQIGLIPGWAGMGRVITKAGTGNAEAMALTARETSSRDLLAIGIYNEVVDVSDPLPRMKNTGDRARDKQDYMEALQANDDSTGGKLLPRAFELAVISGEHIPLPAPGQRKILASDADIRKEVNRRKDPLQYSNSWGKTLKEAASQLETLGRPLAPQSIEAMEELMSAVDQAAFEEDAFVEKEMLADAALYRDPRLLSGIVATLEQKVADFREV